MRRIMFRSIHIEILITETEKKIKSNFISSINLQSNSPEYNLTLEINDSIENVSGPKIK